MTPETPPPRRSQSVILNFFACFAILAASVLAIFVINWTKPTAQQINATRKSAALVETVTVTRGVYSPTLVVLGTVEPAQDVVLSPQVRGQVLELSPELIPGGMVAKGDVLLKIDSADFENALSIRKSELAQAQASLRIEDGRQSVAKKELKLLADSIQDTDRALVLREPQFASIKAEVSAAEAAVKRAELDLSRTTIFAPFDAQVINRSVNVGSQVAPGDDLAQLVGVDEYWVIAAIPIRNLRWVQFPSADELGSTVVLRHPDAWGPDVQRRAHVTRMIGTLDRQTRLARVLITVADPLGLDTNVRSLILDTLIEVRIQGKPIEDVVRLRREYVHDGDTVWVMKDDKLEIRKTVVVFRDAEFAYIRTGLDSDEEVVTTTLATVANGVGLRRVNGDSANDDSGTESTD